MDSSNSPEPPIPGVSMDLGHIQPPLPTGAPPLPPLPPLPKEVKSTNPIIIRPSAKGVENAKKRLRAFSIQKKVPISATLARPSNSGTPTVLIGKLSSAKPPAPKPEDDPKKPPKPPKPGAARKLIQGTYTELQKQTLIEIEDMKRKMELVDLGIPLGLICPTESNTKAMPTKAMPPIKSFLDSAKVDEIIREAKKARAEGKEFKFDYNKYYDNPFQRNKKDDRDEDKAHDKPDHTSKIEGDKNKRKDDKTKYDYHRYSDHRRYDKIKFKHISKKYTDGRKMTENDTRTTRKSIDKETHVDLNDYLVCDSWSLENDDTKSSASPKPTEEKVEHEEPKNNEEKPNEVEDLEEISKKVHDATKVINKIVLPYPILPENVAKMSPRFKSLPQTTEKKIEKLQPVVDSLKFEIDPNELDPEKEDDVLDIFDTDSSIEKYATVNKEPPKPFDYTNDISKDTSMDCNDEFLESLIDEIKRDDTCEESTQDKSLVGYDMSPKDDEKDSLSNMSCGSITPDLDDKIRELTSSRSDFSDGYRSTDSGCKSTESGYKSAGSHKSDVKRDLRVADDGKPRGDYDRKSKGARKSTDRRSSDKYRMSEEKEVVPVKLPEMSKPTMESLETWSFILKICQPLLFRHDKNKCYKETHTAPKVWFTENPKVCSCVKDRSIVYEELEMCKMSLVDRVYGCDQYENLLFPRIQDAPPQTARGWYPRLNQCLVETSAVAMSSEWEVDDSQAAGQRRSLTPQHEDMTLDLEYQKFMEAVRPETRKDTPRSTTPDKLESTNKNEAEEAKRKEEEEEKKRKEMEEEKKKDKKLKLEEGWSQESDIEEPVPVKKQKVEKEKQKEKSRKRKHSTSTLTSSSETDEVSAKKKKKDKKSNKKAKAKSLKRRRNEKKYLKKLKVKEKKKKKNKIQKIDDSEEEKEKKKEKKSKKKQQKLKKNLKKKKSKAKSSSSSESSSSSDSSSDSESEELKQKKRKVEGKKKKDKKKKRKHQTSDSQSDGQFDDGFDVNVLKNIKTEKLTDDETYKNMTEQEFSPRRQQRPRQEIIDVKELQNDFVENIQIKQEKIEENKSIVSEKETRIEDRKEEDLQQMEHSVEEPTNVEKVITKDRQVSQRIHSVPQMIPPPVECQMIPPPGKIGIIPAPGEIGTIPAPEAIRMIPAPGEIGMIPTPEDCHRIPMPEDCPSQDSSQDSAFGKDKPAYEKDDSHLRPSSQNSNYSFNDVINASQSGHYPKGVEESFDQQQGNYEMYEQMAMAYQNDVASQLTSPPGRASASRIETLVTRGEITCDWRAGDAPRPQSTRPSRWGLKPSDVNIVLTGGDSPAPPAPPAPVYRIQSLANRNDSSRDVADYDEAYMDMYGASDRLQYGADCFIGAGSVASGNAAPSTNNVTVSTNNVTVNLQKISTLDDRINKALKETILGEVAIEETPEDKDGQKGILVTKTVSEGSRGSKRVSFADGYKPGQDSDTEQPPARKKKKSSRVGCAWPCPLSHPDHVPLWDALPPPPPPPGSPPPRAARAPPAALLRARPLVQVVPFMHDGQKFDPNHPLPFMPPEPPPGLISFN